MKFSQKNIENWWRWKMSFFLVGHFDFFLKKKFKKNGVFQWKQPWFSCQVSFFENFDDYPGFQLKITHTKHFSRQCNLTQADTATGVIFRLHLPWSDHLTYLNYFFFFLNEQAAYLTISTTHSSSLNLWNKLT